MYISNLLNLCLVIAEDPLHFKNKYAIDKNVPLIPGWQTAQPVLLIG